jgi:translation initiation factor RLI1
MKEIIFIIGENGTGKTTLAKLLTARVEGWFVDTDEFQRLDYSVIPKAIKIIVCEEAGMIEHVVNFYREAPDYMKKSTLIITSNYLSKELIKDASDKFDCEVLVFELA